METRTSSPHVPVREAWLAQVHEEILEPDLPIVDPHHHLWERLGARYLFEELLGDTASGHRVGATEELAPTLEAAFRAGGVQLVAVPIDYSENKRVLVDELKARLPVVELD